MACERSLEASLSLADPGLPSGSTCRGRRCRRARLSANSSWSVPPQSATAEASDSATGIRHATPPVFGYAAAQVICSCRQLITRISAAHRRYASLVAAHQMAATSRQSGVSADHGSLAGTRRRSGRPIVTSASSALRHARRAAREGMSRRDATRAGGRSVVTSVASVFARAQLSTRLGPPSERARDHPPRARQPRRPRASTTPRVLFLPSVDGVYSAPRPCRGDRQHAPWLVAAAAKVTK
jgi:hypothetical protein